MPVDAARRTTSGANIQAIEGNGGDKVFGEFLATHYHQPSDQPDLPFNWAAGAKFARINYLIAREIADQAERPRWYRDSFFGNTFAASQPRADR